MLLQTLVVLFAPLWLPRLLKLRSSVIFERPPLSSLMITCPYIIWNIYAIFSALRHDIFFATNTSIHSPSFILKRNYRAHIERTGHDSLGLDLLLEKLPEHSKISELLDMFGMKILVNCFACHTHQHYVIFHLYHAFLDYFYFMVVVGLLTFNCKNSVRLFALLPAGCLLVLETLWVALEDKSIELLYSFFQSETISHYTLGQLSKSVIYIATALVLLFLKFEEADSKFKTVAELSRAVILQLRQLNRIQVVRQDSGDADRQQ